MSRFINFASNLLDGVDSIAKDSLTDQDLAAAAAERRRSRRRKEVGRGDAAYGGSSAAEQSESGLSEDGSHYDAPGVRQHGQEATPSKGAEHFDAAGGAASTADADGDFVEGGGRQVQASIAAAYENETGAAAAVATAASALTPGKEDGGVWSDPDGFSSTAPSRSSRGRESAGGDINDSPLASASASATPNSRRPRRLQGNLLDPARGPTDVERDDEDPEGGDNETVKLYAREVEEAFARASSFADGSSVSNASMRVNASLSPAMSPLPLHQDHRHRRELVAEALGGDGDRFDGGGAMIETASGADRVGTGHGTSGMTDSAGAVTRSAPGVTVGSDLKGNSSASRGAGGRERRGFGNLLGIGGRRAGRSVAEEDMKALKAEAAELREEVEDLSLELEDAEDRLRGQDLELQAAGEEMKRQRVETQHREDEMEREMEELRALQAEEKKLFLANLGEAEKKLKDKERQADEARSALSALEAFAMEREDAAARLKHEKEELLEELKGVRSGQDRSAEELREALTRAEKEKEEAESRHRVWMRQAQARQTELEATATQLAEALAKAKRRQEGSRGEGGGTRAEGARGSSHSSDRELRAARDELESCQASLELELERSRALQQEVTALLHDLDAARATEAVAEKQRQEHANMAADAFAKVSRLEQRLQQEKVLSQRIGAAAPTPTGTESQVQSLSSKLLDKQARLEESVRERATLSVKLKEALGRANRAEQELWEARGDSLEAGGDVEAPGMRSRRRLGMGGRTSGGAAWSRLAPIAKHKKIATAVDVVDRRTLQAVVFLRNSSMARAFFLGYLLLLHLLAFVILAFHSSNMKPPQGAFDPTG